MRLAWAMVALLVLAGCRGEPAGIGPAVGSLVPDVEMHAVGGEAARLGDWRGRTLILNVWAPWCPPCIAEMPSLQRLSDRLDPQRFAVIGLAPADDPYLVEEFLRKQAIRFANFIDRSGTALPHQLGVNAYPQTFVVGPDGTLLARIVGLRHWDESPMLERIITWGAAPEGKG